MVLVRAASQSHREAIVLVFPKGRDDSAEVARLVVQFEVVELHAEIDLGKEFVSSPPSEDVSDNGHGVLSSLDIFVQFPQVAQPSNGPVLFRLAEGRQCPFAPLHG